jgi:ABC-type transporter Mla subunit MlaD
MQVLKILFMLIAIVSVPLLSFFLIHLFYKISRGVTHINRTLDDARPQLNMLLTNLNHTVEDINNELGKVGLLTDEAQEMILRTEKSLQSVEEVLRSPIVRYGGLLAGFYTTTLLVRGTLRRNERRLERAKRMM